MLRQSRAIVILVVLLVGSLVLNACQSASAPPASSNKDEKGKTEASAKPAEQTKTETSAKPSTKEPYRIGALWELSGPAAANGIGKEARDAALLEVERINAAGGIDGHPLELIVADSGSDPSVVTTALTKLIRQDKVLAVEGPGYNVTFPAAMGVAEREQMPIIVGNSLTPEQRAQNPKWTFPQMLGEVGSADSIVDILKDKGLKKVVAISDGSPYYSATFARFKAVASSAGIEVFSTGDTFSLADLDLTPQVGKMKELAAKERPQALVLITSGQPAVPFLKAMKQLGLDLPVVGLWGLGMPFILQQSGDEVNGVMFAGIKMLAPDQLDNSDPQKSIILDYLKRFKAKYGRDAIPPSATGADPINLIANALKTSGPDRAKLRDALEATSNFAALNGIISYNTREGLGKNSLAVFEIRDKKFNYVRPIK